MPKNIFSNSWIARSFAGWIVIYTGYLLIIMLSIAVQFWTSSLLRSGVISDTTRDAITGGLIGVSTSFFYGWSRFVWTYGHRIMSRSAIEVLRFDTRPPVLYLRSFSSDEKKPTWRGLPSPSIEENLAQILSEVGPVITIGHPDEWLPPLGAYRMYVGGNNDWRNTVSFLMSKAAVVVVKVGMSKGIEWEIERMVEIVKPQRVLIILPPRSPWQKEWSTEKNYLDFCEMTVDLFPRPLPKRVGSKSFIDFDNDWNAKLLGIHPWRWIIGQGRASKAGIREAIRPFCMNIGYRLHWFPTILAAMFRLSYLAIMAGVIIFSAQALYEPILQDVRNLFQSKELKSDHQTFEITLPSGWSEPTKELKDRLPTTPEEDQLFAWRIQLGRNGYELFVLIEQVNKTLTPLSLDKVSEAILSLFPTVDELTGPLTGTFGRMPAVTYRFKSGKLPYIVIIAETSRNYYYVKGWSNQPEISSEHLGEIETLTSSIAELDK